MYDFSAGGRVGRLGAPLDLSKTENHRSPTEATMCLGTPMPCTLYLVPLYRLSYSSMIKYLLYSTDDVKLSTIHALLFLPCHHSPTSDHHDDLNHSLNVRHVPSTCYVTHQNTPHPGRSPHPHPPPQSTDN